jgi:hypothetical protein
MVLATKLSAVLYAGSLVFCHNFLILSLRFIRQSKPSRSLLRSKRVILLVYSVYIDATEAAKLQDALSASSQSYIGWSSSVNIVAGYGLDNWGLGVQFLAGTENFYPLHHSQTSSGAHPASCPMGTRAPSLGVKQLGCEADHSPTFSPEVKNMWCYNLTPPIYLHGVVLS